MHSGDAEDHKYTPLRESGTPAGGERPSETSKIEAILVRVNSDSPKFQLKVLCTVCLFSFFMGFHAFTFVFMFFSPHFFSAGHLSLGNSVNMPQPAVRLEETRACAGDFSTKAWFWSLTSAHRLYCGRSHLKKLFEGFILFGFSFLAMLLISLQDKFGSKRMVVSGFFLVALPGSFLILGVQGLLPSVLGLLLVWGYINASFSLLMLLSNELLVNPLRNSSNMIYRIVYCLGGFCGTFLVSYLTDYRWIVSAYSAGFGVFTCLLACLVPDSPSFLLKHKRNASLEQTIARIADCNGLSPGRAQPILELLQKTIAGASFE